MYFHRNNLLPFPLHRWFAIELWYATFNHELLVVCSMVRRRGILKEHQFTILMGYEPTIYAFDKQSQKTSVAKASVKMHHHQSLRQLSINPLASTLIALTPDRFAY